MLILDRLLAGLRSACAAFPDARKGEVTYAMADVGMSAFSLFFMKSESFLAYQRSLEAERQTSNCRTLFGMANIPTDATIRSLLPSASRGFQDRPRNPGRLYCFTFKSFSLANTESTSTWSSGNSAALGFFAPNTSS